MAAGAPLLPVSMVLPFAKERQHVSKRGHVQKRPCPGVTEMKLFSFVVFAKSLLLTVVITLMKGWYPGGTLLGFLLIFIVAGGLFLLAGAEKK